MERPDAVRLVGLIEAGWFPMPESKFELYVEKFRGFECAQCLYSAIQGLIDAVHFMPAVADVRDEYGAVHLSAHRVERLSLPAERWTEEDAQRAAERAPEVFARWREFQAQAGEEPDPYALVAHVVSEDEKVESPSQEEIERRRRDALVKLDNAYAAELAQARALTETETTEREQYDRVIVCEQSGHMVEGDSCHCGKVTIDIAGREHGR